MASRRKQPRDMDPLAPAVTGIPDAATYRRGQRREVACAAGVPPMACPQCGVAGCTIRDAHGPAHDEATARQRLDPALRCDGRGGMCHHEATETVAYPDGDAQHLCRACGDFARRCLADISE